ncbi:MAG: ABC transporter substrate-binding protein [Chloroflexota bacterium]
MNNAMHKLISSLILISFVISACTAAAPAAPTQPAAENTIAPAATLPPTETTAPVPTVEPTSTLPPTPLPGTELTPLSSLKFGIPWQEMDKSKIPMVAYYGFNVTRPPFNNPEVRQAFSAALDTQALTSIYLNNTFYKDAIAARTVIPPSMLTRDVTADLGIQYDPVLAKQLFEKAGFTDPSTFPKVTLLVIYLDGREYPGIIIKAAKEAARMWKENLGVTVIVDAQGVKDLLKDQRTLISSGKYDIFEHGVLAGQNDPSDLLSSMFLPDGGNNLTSYTNPKVSDLIQQAGKEIDPAVRLATFLTIEGILSKEDLPIIPIFHFTIDGSNW